MKKWVSVRERNIKLLLETVTYIATTETVTCIITIEIVMCIMHCRNYHLHDCSRDSHVHNFKKIVTHLFAAETFTCINATKRSTNIIVEESTTDIIAIALQNLHNCNRRWDLHNCYGKCQLHSSNKLPPAALTTETFTYRNGASQRSF